MTNPHINTLRTELLATLADLRNRQNPMEPDRAIAQVASVLVDSAKVEVDYIKATGQDNSNFIDGLKAPEAVARIESHQKTAEPMAATETTGPKTQWRFPAGEGLQA